MSDSSPTASRGVRLLEMLPVLAALAMHALTHGRWLLCVPAALVLGALVLRGRRPSHSSRGLLLSAAGGALLGGALLWGQDSLPGPLPPGMMGPLGGALVGLSTFCAASGRLRFATTYALLLVALSAAVPDSVAVYAGLAGVGVSLLLATFLHGGLGRAGVAGVVGFGAFALVTVGASFGLWRFVRFNEGLLTEALYRMVQEAPRPGGFSFQSEVALARRGRMPQTERLLFEVRGARPRLLRTVVLDAFDGSRWTTSEALDTQRRVLAAPAEGEAMLATELTLLERLGTYVPAPAGTRAVEGAGPRVHGGWTLRVDRLEEGSLTLRREAREALPVEPPPDAALTALPEALRAELLPLALELTRGADTPRARARALEAWFQDKHEYSLSVDLQGEGSPLAVLIRERRPAWCVYFASAMAALLRSLDVPARLVGGFVPQEENRLSGAALVRERDAHAWVEVYLEDEGRFVAFDPTPWRSREALQPAPGLLEAALQGAGSLLRRWTSAVLASPLEALGALARSPLVWGPLLAVAAWRLGTRYRHRRATRPRGAMRGAHPELSAAHARYLRVLRRAAGLVPAPSETDEELLGRLRAARGELAARLAEQFLTRYRQARYGGGAVDAASLGALASELERALRQGR